MAKRAPKHRMRYAHTLSGIHDYAQFIRWLLNSCVCFKCAVQLPEVIIANMILLASITFELAKDRLLILW